MVWRTAVELHSGGVSAAGHDGTSTPNRRGMIDDILPILRTGAPWSDSQNTYKPLRPSCL